MCFSPICNIIRNIILVVISIILGVIIAILFANGSIPLIRTIVKASLVLSVILLSGFVAITTLSFFMENPKIKLCLTGPGIPLLISSMGTIVTTIIALGINLVTTSLAAAILIGFGGFFFSLMILSSIFLVICLVRKTRAVLDIL